MAKEYDKFKKKMFSVGLRKERSRKGNIDITPPPPPLRPPCCGHKEAAKQHLFHYNFVSFAKIKSLICVQLTRNKNFFTKIGS